MDENWVNLLAAVYKRAVLDDYASVRTAIKGRLISKGVNKYRAGKYIEKKSEEILMMVRKAVADESQYYGDSQVTKKMQEEAKQKIIEKVVSGYERK